MFETDPRRIRRDEIALTIWAWVFIALAGLFGGLLVYLALGGAL